MLTLFTFTIMLRTRCFHSIHRHINRSKVNQVLSTTVSHANYFHSHEPSEITKLPTLGSGSNLIMSTISTKFHHQNNNDRGDFSFSTSATTVPHVKVELRNHNELKRQTSEFLYTNNDDYDKAHILISKWNNHMKSIRLRDIQLSPFFRSMQYQSAEKCFSLLLYLIEKFKDTNNNKDIFRGEPRAFIKCLECLALGPFNSFSLPSKENRFDEKSACDLSRTILDWWNSMFGGDFEHSPSTDTFNLVLQVFQQSRNINLDQATRSQEVIDLMAALHKGGDIFVNPNLVALNSVIKSWVICLSNLDADDKKTDKIIEEIYNSRIQPLYLQIMELVKEKEMSGIPSSALVSFIFANIHYLDALSNLQKPLQNAQTVKERLITLKKLFDKSPYQSLHKSITEESPKEFYDFVQQLDDMYSYFLAKTCENDKDDQAVVLEMESIIQSIKDRKTRLFKEQNILDTEKYKYASYPSIEHYSIVINALNGAINSFVKDTRNSTPVYSNPKQIVTYLERMEELLNDVRDIISMKVYVDNSERQLAEEMFGICLETWKLTRNVYLPNKEERAEEILLNFLSLVSEQKLFRENKKQLRDCIIDVMDLWSACHSSRIKKAADRIEFLLQECILSNKSLGLAPSNAVLSRVILGFSRAGEKEKVFEYLALMEDLLEDLGPDAFGLIANRQYLRALVDIKGSLTVKETKKLLSSLERLYNKYREYPNNYLKPHVMVYNGVIDAIGRSGQIGAAQEAQLLFDSMLKKYEETQDKSYEPNTKIYSSLIGAWRREQDVNNKVIELDNVQPGGDLDINTELPVKNALQLLDEMQSIHKCRPDISTYSHVLLAIARSSLGQGAQSKTHEILLDMKSKNISLSPIAYSAVLETVLRSNSYMHGGSKVDALEKSMEYLETMKNHLNPSQIYLVLRECCNFDKNEVRSKENDLKTWYTVKNAFFVWSKKNNTKENARNSYYVATPFRKAAKRNDRVYGSFFRACGVLGTTLDEDTKFNRKDIVLQEFYNCCADGLLTSFVSNELLSLVNDEKNETTDMAQINDLHESDFSFNGEVIDLKNIPYHLRINANKRY